MSDDHSPGDARKPYSDVGGPEARHAQTHDVARELATNPKGPEVETEDYEADLEGNTPEKVRAAHEEAAAVAGDKRTANALPELSKADISALSVLPEGTPLEQGAVYLDLNDHGSGEFTALGGQQAESSQQLVAKKLTDHELWNRLLDR